MVGRADMVAIDGGAPSLGPASDLSADNWI